MRRANLYFAVYAIVMLSTGLISATSQAQPWEPPPETPKQQTPPPVPQSDALKDRGFQSSIFLGFHKYLGNAGKDFDPGIRLGGLLGIRFSELLSLQGELTFDFENPNNSNSTPGSLGLSIVPMFHLAMGSGELRLAPKFGIWMESVSFEMGGQKIEQTSRGALLGATFALAFRAGGYVLGPVLALEQVRLSKTCLKQLPFDATCRSVSEVSADGGNKTVGVASLSFALWF